MGNKITIEEMLKKFEEWGIRIVVDEDKKVWYETDEYGLMTPDFFKALLRAELTHRGVPLAEIYAGTLDTDVCVETIEEYRRRKFHEILASLDKTPTAGCVYVIEWENNLVKIGRSKDPEARIAALKTQVPIKSKRVYISDKTENWCDMETKAHHHFSEYRKHGEYFDLPFEKAVEYIEKLTKKTPLGMGG